MKSAVSPTKNVKSMKVSQLMEEGIKFFSRHLFSLIALGVVACLPLFAFIYYAKISWQQDPIQFKRNMNFYMYCAIALGAMAIPLFQGMVIHFTCRHLEKGKGEVGSSIRVAFPRVISLGATGGIIFLATFVGTMAFIVPGLIVLTVSILALPMVMQENISSIEALKKSAQYTEGHRLSIFKAMFGLAGLAMLVKFSLSFLIVGVGEVEGAIVLVKSLVGISIDFLFLAMWAVMSAIFYYHLTHEDRVRRRLAEWRMQKEAAAS